MIRDGVRKLSGEARAQRYIDDAGAESEHLGPGSSDRPKAGWRPVEGGRSASLGAGAKPARTYGRNYGFRGPGSVGPGIERPGDNDRG